MSIPLEKALAYLDALEADRQAALALSEQKAEEAKLIQARQEGFQAAMKILGGEIPVGNAESDPEEPGRRRARRRIPQLILGELSFSGQAVSATQIAKAIGYNLEGTQTALTRLEKAGQVLRNGEGRWAIGITAVARIHGPRLWQRQIRIAGRPSNEVAGPTIPQPSQPSPRRSLVINALRA